MGNEPTRGADPLADALLRELSELFNAPRPSDQPDQPHFSRWRADDDDFLQANKFRPSGAPSLVANIKADLQAGLPPWLAEQMKLSPVGTDSTGRIAVRLEFTDLDGRGYTVPRPDVITSALSPPEDMGWREEGDKRRVRVATAVSYEEFTPQTLSESVRAPISVIAVTDPLWGKPPEVHYRLMHAESVSELLPRVFSNFKDSKPLAPYIGEEAWRTLPKKETFAEAVRRAYRDPRDQDFSLGQYLIEEALRDILHQKGVVLDINQRPEIIAIAPSKKPGADLEVNYVVPSLGSRPSTDLFGDFRLSVDNNVPSAKQVL